MTAVRTASDRTPTPSPRHRLTPLHVVGRRTRRRPDDEAGGGRRRGALRRALRSIRLSGPAVVAVSLVATIAVAVVLQAQQVSGESVLQDLRADLRDASRTQTELRATVAEAESPSKVIEVAESQGMVEPAAAVAIPAPGIAEEDPGAATPGAGAPEAAGTPSPAPTGAGPATVAAPPGTPGGTDAR